MKNIFYYFTLFAVTSFLFAKAVIAQDTQTKVRLNQIEAKFATSNAKTATSSNNGKNKASISFFSSIVLVNSNSVLTVFENGKIINIYTNDSTKYLNFDSGGKKLIGIGDLKVNDTILIIGIAKDSNPKIAKLIVRDQTKSVNNFSLIGKIIELKENSISLGQLTRKDLPPTVINFSQNLSILTTGNKTLEKSSLTQNQTIIATGIIDEKGNFQSKQIFLPFYKVKSPSSAKQ